MVSYFFSPIVFTKIVSTFVWLQISEITKKNRRSVATHDLNSSDHLKISHYHVAFWAFWPLAITLTATAVLILVFSIHVWKMLLHNQASFFPLFSGEHRTTHREPFIYPKSSKPSLPLSFGRFCSISNPW